MEAITNIEDFVRTAPSDITPIDWSNGTGYGDGFGNGIACGGTVQDGKCGTNKYDVSSSLWGLSEYEHSTVYHLEDMPVIIYNIIDNVAEGAIIHPDMTLKKGFIAKCNNSFAFANSIGDAKEEAKKLAQSRGEDTEDSNNF